MDTVCPVRVALHTRFGPVALDPIALAVLPGTDDVLVRGFAMLEVLDLDIYAGLTECTRRKPEGRAQLVKNANYVACRRVSLSVEAMQQQPTNEQIGNKAAKHVVESGPEMVMDPVIEETEQKIRLEDAVRIIAKNGLDLPPFAGWRRMMLEHCWIVFRRAFWVLCLRRVNPCM